MGLLRIADERGPTVRLGWPDPAYAGSDALLEGDLDALVEAVARDAEEVHVTDMNEHPLWLLAGQQTWSSTIRACLPLLTSERIQADLLTDGLPSEQVATLRWDPTRLQPRALRGGLQRDGSGAGSRGCPTQEYLAWRGLGDSLWCPYWRDQGHQPCLVWPVWREMLAPAQALAVIQTGPPAWRGRSVVWTATMQRSSDGRRREIGPGWPTVQKVA